MNYAYHYFKIIANRVEHPLTKDDCYVERHHVIPKSEGGLDTKDNLVNLTAREHYICHLLLARIYDDHKMWAAVSLFRRGKYRQTNFRFSSRLYEQARKRLGGELSKMFKGRPGTWNGRHHTDETKEKLRLAHIGRKAKNPKSEETRRKLSLALKGKKKSPEAIRRHADAIRGRHLSEEHKRKLSLAGKGRKYTEKEIERRRKMLMGNTIAKGMSYWNNGERYVRSKECPG